MEAEFKKEQIVWAKVNGYPWWPGFIRAVLKSDTFEVVFFGDFSHAELQSCKIRDFQDCAEKVDKKNKKLLQAVRVADRIAKGESSIAREEGRYEAEIFQNPGRASLNQPRQQLKAGESSDGSEEESNTDQLARASKNEGLGRSRRTSQVIECNAGALDSLTDLNSKIGIERFKSNISSDKGRLEPVSLKTHASLRPNASDNVLNEPRRLRKLKSLTKTPTEFEQILNQEFQNDHAPEPSAPQNLPGFGPKNVDLPLEESGAQLAQLNDQIAQLLSQLRSEELKPEQIAQQLKSLALTMSDPVLRIWDTAGRKMGSSISLIAFLSLERTKDSTSYPTVLDALNGLIINIKRALCEAFFRTEDEMSDCITLKPQISHFDDFGEPLPSLNRNLSSNSIYRPSEKFLKSIICKSSKINNSKLMDKRALLEKEELSGNGEARSGSAAWDADHRIVFRVCKKIAKLIYLNGGKNTIRKQTCEDLANKIEEFVRKSSPNLVEYKHKVITLFQKIEKRPEIVQSSFIKNCKGNNLELLFDQVHAFINN